ncbi:hypothetical protein HSX11_06565 [Oxalobacteraceae bacterium]|nr:hypothetical protein [Oxalobacteraceae bacterium]
MAWQHSIKVDVTQYPGFLYFEKPLIRQKIFDFGAIIKSQICVVDAHYVKIGEEVRGSKGAESGRIPVNVAGFLSLIA